MDNYPDSPGSGDEDMWSEVDEAFPDSARSGRRDGFTPKRRRVFLKTLRKTGCVQDACRRAGLSDTAAYKLRDRDPMFARLWDTAAACGGADMALLAWHYAVEGEEVEVWAYGKKVGTRRKRDAGLFRILLQSSNPHKYGGSALGSRKQIERKIRRELEEAQQAAEPELSEEQHQELVDRIAGRIERLRQRMLREEGGFIDAEDRYIPAGYVRIADLPQPEPAAGAGADAAIDLSAGGVAAAGRAPDVSARPGHDHADSPDADGDRGDTEAAALSIGSWRSCPRPQDA